MKRNRFTDEQIVVVLRGAEATTVVEAWEALIGQFAFWGCTEVAQVVSRVPCSRPGYFSGTVTPGTLTTKKEIGKIKVLST